MIWCVEDDSSIRDIEIYTLLSTGFEAKGFEDPIVNISENEVDVVINAASVTDQQIAQIEEQLRQCLDTLAKIREDAAPCDAPAEQEDVAGEISHNLESLVGTIEDAAPTAEPKHPVSETTSKFANLQFGPNSNPTKK